MTPATHIDIITNPLSAQFEAVRDGTVVGLLAYDKHGDHLDLRHTFVPPELRGQHIAPTLVRTALDRIQTTGGTVSVACTYVEAFIDQHPEYAGLVQHQPSSAPTSRTGTAPATTTTRTDPAPVAPGAHPDALNVFPDTIRTERLTLRPWTLDDTDDAYRIYSDPRVTRWTRPFIGPVTTPEQMRRQLDLWISQSDHVRPPQGRWAIEDSETGRLVGGAQMLQMPAEAGSRLVTSWELAASATGQGFAAEAGHGLVHSAFTIDGDLDTVHALVHPQNHAAVATLDRIGLAPVPGVEHHYGADLVLYAISRTHFEALEDNRSKNS